METRVAELLASIVSSVRLDEDGERESADREIVKLGRGALRHLAVALQDPDPMTRACAARAIELVANGAPGNDDVTDVVDVLERSLADPDFETRQHAFNALAILDRERAIQAIDTERMNGMKHEPWQLLTILRERHQDPRIAAALFRMASAGHGDGCDILLAVDAAAAERAALAALERDIATPGVVAIAHTRASAILTSALVAFLGRCVEPDCSSIRAAGFLRDKIGGSFDAAALPTLFAAQERFAHTMPWGALWRARPLRTGGSLEDVRANLDHLLSALPQSVKEPTVHVFYEQDRFVFTGLAAALALATAHAQAPASLRDALEREREEARRDLSDWQGARGAALAYAITLVDACATRVRSSP